MAPYRIGRIFMHKKLFVSNHTVLFCLVASFFVGYLSTVVANPTDQDPARFNTTRDTFVIERAELQFNQTPLALPAPAQTWIEVLGQPSKTIVHEHRYTHEKTTIYVWEQHGMDLHCEYAYKDYSPNCDFVFIKIRPSSYDLANKNTTDPILTGRLTLEQLEITRNTKIPEIRHQLSTTGRFLFGSNTSYFYRVCQPTPKTVRVKSEVEQDSPQYRKITSVSIGLYSADDNTPCKEALGTPYQSVTEAMAFGLFEQAKLYVNEQGECDRTCVEKRTAAFKQLLESANQRAKESSDPVEQDALEQFQSLVNRLKSMDEAEQDKQKSKTQ